MKGSITALALAILLTPAMAQSNSIWQVDSTPNEFEFNNLLTSAGALAPDDVWAVGQLAIHWDGQSWSSVPLEYPPGVHEWNFILNGAATVASDNVWAAGGYYTSADGIYHPVIEHWDGQAWSISPSPILQNSGGLSGIAAVAADDIWATGSRIFSGSNEPLFEHWNGAEWMIVPVDLPGHFFLKGISAVSSSDIWAVGLFFNPLLVQQTLAMHWDGTSWSVVPTPNVGTGPNELWDVIAVASNDVWAVGFSTADPPPHPREPTLTLVEHWDGTQWSVVPSPNVGPDSVYQDNRLFGITAVCNHDLWAAGSYFAADGLGQQSTLIEHWDGAEWTISDSPSPDRSDILFKGASLPPGNVWFAGGKPFGSLILETSQGCSLALRG